MGMRETLWNIGGEVVDLSRRGMIMGVLNVTPDSFSGAGEFFTVDKAVAHGVKMASEGADIIDVGGESTRPGAEPISIDTSKSEVAEGALDAGASIVNDVTGGRGDKKMMELIAERKAAFIIMHMRGNPRTMQVEPRYDDVISEVADFFRQQYECALECGIDPMSIAFDPGIGFGKTLEHNLALIANLEALRVHERPLLIGVSRKSFLAKLIGSTDMRERLAPAVALTSLLRARGADMFRVHDVKENANALRVAEAIVQSVK